MEFQNVVANVTNEHRIQSEEDEFANLSIDALNKKVEDVKKLYFDKKIKPENSFDIPIINLVLRIVKTPTVNSSNFLEISGTFDAISEVYTCRFDDYLSSANRFVREFLKITKPEDQVHIINNEIKIKPRNKEKLTTSDKLNHTKSDLLFSKKNFHVHFKNDIVDYANPSKILLNRFNNEPYWPDYKFSTQEDKNNPPKKFKMKNLTNIIRKGKICPAFHEFVAEKDRILDDRDSDELNCIEKRFDGDTSVLNRPISDNDPVIFVEPMNVDGQDLSDIDDRSTLSQILPLINEDHGDYSFFDYRITHLPCNNRWIDKFKHPGSIGKIRPKSSIPTVANDDLQTSCRNSTSANQLKKSVDTEFIVDFSSDINEKLEKIKNKHGKNMCDYQSWTPYKNIAFQVECPVRRLKMCEFINIIPKWYKTDSATLNGALDATANSLLLQPQQNTQEDNILSNNISTTKTVENIVNGTIHTDNGSSHKLHTNETEINGTSDFNMLSSDDDTDDESEYLYKDPGNLDIHQLKNDMLSIINPAGMNMLNITFKDVALEMQILISEKMNQNISVSDMYVALLHLSNVHNLRLTNIDSSNILISKQN